MKGKELDPIDAELRRRLQEGDPAGDGADLARDEVARMRETVLAEAESTRFARPVIAWKPALALATIAVVIGIGWWISRDVATALPRTEEIAAADPVPDPPLPPPSEPVEAVEPIEPVEIAHVPEPAAVVAMAVETPPPEEPAAAVLKEERSSRQIRFTTSSGTQIIWVLDPEFKS